MQPFLSVDDGNINHTSCVCTPPPAPPPDPPIPMTLSHEGAFFSSLCCVCRVPFVCRLPFLTLAVFSVSWSLATPTLLGFVFDFRLTHPVLSAKGRSVTHPVLSAKGRSVTHPVLSAKGRSVTYAVPSAKGRSVTHRVLFCLPKDGP